MIRRADQLRLDGSTWRLEGCNINFTDAVSVRVDELLPALGLPITLEYSVWLKHVASIRVMLLREGAENCLYSV